MEIYNIELPNGKIVPFEGNQPPTSADYDAIVAAEMGPPPSSGGFNKSLQSIAEGLETFIGDAPVSVAKSIIGAGETAVGQAEIAHKLNPVSALADVAGMDIGSIGNMLRELGYKPKETKRILSGLQSKQLRDAQQRVNEADGFIGTAAELVKNPPAAADMLIESGAPMLLGGAQARAISRFAPALASTAPAIGEGLGSAGSTAEQIRQETGNVTPKQAAIAGGSGIATGGINRLGNLASVKLGVADIDALVAGQQITKAQGSRMKRATIGSMLEAGEETVQSGQEQAAQNLALGKPIGEGVSEAMGSGTVLGGIMGSGTNLTAQADQAASAKTAASASRQANEIAMKKPSQSDNLAAAMALEEITKQPEPTNADPEGKVVIGNIGASGATPGMLDVYSPAPLADKSAEESALAMLAAEPAVPANPASDTALAQGAATPQDVEYRWKELNQQVVERYWRAKKDLTKAEQDLAIKQQLAKEESFKIDERRKVADAENYAQELVTEVARQEGVTYDDVVKTRANHPNVTAWIEDLESRWIKGYGVSEAPRPTKISDLIASGKGERRLLNQEDYISSLNARNEQSRAGAKSGLGESLEGFQPVPAEEPLDFGMESAASPEAQSEQGLGFLTKVKTIQENMAKVGVDLPRETAVKMARLSPEEFVQARQQLINSVPKEGKAASGDVKMKSIADLEAGFFPPGEDFPQATPQNIAARMDAALESLKIYKGGAARSGDPFTLTWDAAITTAQVAIRTGARVAEAVKAAVEYFKKAYPEATQNQIDELGGKISGALMTLKHGTPHEIIKKVGDRDVVAFDRAKRLSGEGTAAFGAGDTYAAQREGVAKSYMRNRVAGDWRFFVDGKEVHGKDALMAEVAQVNMEPYGGNMALTLEQLERTVIDARKQKALDFGDGQPESPWINSVIEDNLEAIEAVKKYGASEIKKVERIGNLYDIEAHIPDDSAIHWDKGFGRNPKKVIKAFSDAGINETGITTAPASDVYRMLAEKLGGESEASDYLASKGVRGIKFMDRPSRDIYVSDPMPGYKDSDGEWVHSQKTWSVGTKYRGSASMGYREFDSYNKAQDFIKKFKEKNISYNYVLFDGKSAEITAKNGEPIPADQRYRAEETTDSIIRWLEGKKLSEPGMTFSGETAILVKSWDLAIDAAIAVIKAGKAIAQATAEAIEVFKKNYPSASKAQIDLLKSEIEDVASAPATPDTESEGKKERKYAEGVWRPFLTDFSKSAIAQRKDMAGTAMRWFGETPVARAIETGAKLMKNAGTVSDNIFNVLPAAKGVFSKMNQAMSDAIVLWTDKSLPPIKEARKVFGSKFDDFSRLLISRTFTGDSTELDALVASTPGGSEVLAKIEANEGWGGVREAMFNAEKAVRAGDDSFKKQDNYYPLVVADGQLENLLDLISENGDRHEIEKVLNQAKRDKAKETGDKGAELTREEQGAIIGKHIFGTLFQGRGAPGFTKKRNIATITKEMSKFIEPIDVAIETRIMQVAKDVTARQFFGKIDTSGEDILPTDIEPTSPFGLVLADAIKNKEITPEGLDVILDNVKDYFSNNRGASPAAWKFGRFIGDMAVYAHLNSFSSAFINAADAFSTAAREGPSAAGQALGAAVGHRLAKIPGLSSFEPETYTTLKDIKFHEGAMDTAEYMRGNGAFKKFLRDSMKFIQGSMDSFGKEIALNAARINASNVMNKDSGRSFLATRDQQFERIQSVMANTHPDVWPEMKKSLMSEGFAKNDLDDMGRLYLRERLSDAQPMTRAEQAQGKLALHPGFKPIFALKSFMLRQIGTIRNNTYEELKRGNVTAAAAWFGVYALWTMAGQVIVRCIVAKAMRKDCGGLDSWLSAFTGIFGMNKYSLSGLTRGDPAGTAIDMITPPLTPVNSLFKDVMLTRDAISGRKIEGTGRPVVRNIGDFLGQAESYKHLPMGKDVYDWFGAGRTKELKKQADEKRGKKEKTITGELKNMMAPPPKKAN